MIVRVQSRLTAIKYNHVSRFRSLLTCIIPFGYMLLTILAERSIKPLYTATRVPCRLFYTATTRCTVMSLTVIWQVKDGQSTFKTLCHTFGYDFNAELLPLRYNDLVCLPREITA